jgi:hypothetical protein
VISDTPSVSQLSQVISQAAAPAFLLGALAAFIAVLISRLNRIVDRTMILNGIPDDDAARSRLKAYLPRLDAARRHDEPGNLLGGDRQHCGNDSRNRRFFNCVLSTPA